MPSSTFFNLPEEKRCRLVNAAWKTFTHTDFGSATISQIIEKAQVPRGSFYQYFGGKEDLFFYLIDDMQNTLCDTFQSLLVNENGDLFAIPLPAFDNFVAYKNKQENRLSQYIKILHLNPGMGIENLLSECAEQQNARLLPHIDSSAWYRHDNQFKTHILFLVMASWTYAVMETLSVPHQQASQRYILKERIELIRVGAMKII